jgi:hypothetical protein
MQKRAAALASIMVRPRATMRRILEGGRDRMVIPIVALFAVSGFLGDLDKGAMESLGRQQVPFPVLFAGLMLLAVVVVLVMFYLYAWALFGIGRLLEGTGTVREVRSAAAWGLVPAIWALLYRIPVATLWPASLPAKVELKAGQWQLSPGGLGMGCLAIIFVMFLELVVFAWCVTLSSNTLGEAHRFSSWRGLASIVLTLISPALIALAAFLAS